MGATTFAVIADIHGNSFALTSVLAEIQRRNITTIINLGDILYGPLDPLGTFDVLQRAPFSIVSIGGNGDRIVLPALDESVDKGSALYTKRLLSQVHKDWLRGLPAVFANDQMFACHGTPESDETYLLEEMHARGGILKPVADILPCVRDVPQPLVLCGHSHLPRVVYLPDGRLVVNPGSVGLPAYQDDLPVPHKMETGTPHAQCALLSGEGRQWQVEQLSIPYDWQAAATMAASHGAHRWASALSTGRAG